MKDIVRKILLTPIKFAKKKDGIYMKDGYIYSTITYQTIDMDMSDIAIDFYEIIYQDILQKAHILNQKKILNENFAGDSMNSFNTIANMVPEAGKSRSVRTACSEWPSFLQEYGKQWECLANYWVQPLTIGRKSNGYKEKDSLDIYMINVKENKELLDRYPDYFSNFESYSDFCKKHFVREEYNKELIQKYYKEKQAEQLVSVAMRNISERADMIVESEKCEMLYDYFLSKNLI